IPIGFDVSPQNSGVSILDYCGFNTYGNTRGSSGFLQSLAYLLWVSKPQFGSTINKQLRSIHVAYPKGLGIGALPLAPQSGGIRIFPAVMIPVVDMFAKNDQLSAGNWLPRFQLLNQRIGWRTTGTSFRCK